uniref:Uncharacterized protein n=1 Tax=Oryza sativa subsp. japonica TaxID=39947 RepID=Q6EUA4_ORYSJ|nr:hypothetical protein [Oryza sativa Japonica Group]
MRRRDERQWRPGDGTLPSRFPRCPRLAEAVSKRAARPGPARARVRHGPFRHGPLGTADETGRAVPAHVPSRRPKHGPWMAGPCPCRHGTPAAHGPFGARRPVKAGRQLSCTGRQAARPPAARPPVHSVF